MKKFIYILIAIVALNGCGGGSAIGNDSANEQSKSSQNNKARNSYSCAYVNPINGNCEQ